MTLRGVEPLVLRLVILVGMSGASTLVACTLGDPHPLMLPASRFSEERKFISGGERSIYELAVAAASAGIDVELRGDLNQPILETIVRSAGASPRVDLEARRPRKTDIVVTPEGAAIDILATAVLSEAKWVMYMLAAPGLMGWSFLPNWSRPDPMTVPLEALGRPETFRAIDRLGFRIWSNSHGIVEGGVAAGVSVEWLGTGTPVPFPDASERSYEFALIENNRWASWAEDLASRFGEARTLRIGPTPSVYSLCDQLAKAKVLMWPSRVEGLSRLSREARAVGTVPVSWNVSPFATTADHGSGVIFADGIEDIEQQARRLLADPDRLSKLSVEAMLSARAQADWPSFISRVEKAVAAVESAPSREGGFVSQAIGDHVRGRWLAESKAQTNVVTALTHNLASLEGQVGEIRRTADYFAAKHGRAETEVESLRQQIDLAASRIDALLQESVQLRSDVGSRLAESEGWRAEAESLTVQAAALTAQAASLRDHVMGVEAELEAYKARFAIRLIDRSPIAPAWRALRRASRATP